MLYTDIAIEHFMNPRNVGEISGADGVGVIGSEECGDMIKVWVKVANQRLVDIKYKVSGHLAVAYHLKARWLGLTSSMVLGQVLMVFSISYTVTQKNSVFHILPWLKHLPERGTGK